MGCLFTFPPQNCSSHGGIWTPIQHLVPWSHPSPQPEQHLNRFSRFCMAHDHDRQTDRPRYPICNNRLHLVVLQCGLIVTSGQSNMTKKAKSPPHMDSSMVVDRCRQCAHHLIHASLGPPESKSQTASPSVEPCLHSSPQSVPILYNGPSILPSKLPHPME